MTKDLEQKRRFVELRAEGKSYSAIAGELGISKATCTAWAQDLAGQIREAENDRLQEICTAYGLQRAARISRLGQTLQRLDAEIQKRDLSKVPLDKLIDLQLKCARAIREESLNPVEGLPEGKPQEIAESCRRIYERLQAGELSSSEAQAQLQAIRATEKAVNIASDPLAILNLPAI